MEIEFTLPSLLLIGGLFAFLRERFCEQPLSPGYLEGMGFEKYTYTDKGVPVSCSYIKWDDDRTVMLTIKGERYYLDGTDFEVRTTGQLKKLYEGLTGEKL